METSHKSLFFHPSTVKLRDGGELSIFGRDWQLLHFSCRRGDVGLDIRKGGGIYAGSKVGEWEWSVWEGNRGMRKMSYIWM